MNLLKKDFLLLRAVHRCIVPHSHFNQDKIKINEKSLIDIDKEFRGIPNEKKNKANFMAAIELFRESRGARGRGHVEFINAALKNLKDFGLHKDLDTYKALLNIFPKGIMIPQNFFQKMFLHFPVQQVCCVHLLDEMEWHGVQPDKEIHDIVVNTFGEWTYAGKKAKRMLYWMPKLKNTNNYLDRRLVENKNFTGYELARIALKMMCRDSGTILSNINVRKPNVDAIFGSWLVSAQSPLQRIMIRDLPPSTCYYVDGPFFVYVQDKRVEYCVLSTNSQQSTDDEFIDQRTFHNYENLHEQLFDIGEPTNIHQQADQTILAMCAMEENTARMASAWLNHLQSKNPALNQASILIRVKEEERDIDVWVESNR